MTEKLLIDRKGRGAWSRWLEEWQRADRAGDKSAVTAARKALGSTRDWHILAEMDTDGDYTNDVWAFADRVRAGRSLKKLSEPGDCSADE